MPTPTPVVVITAAGVTEVWSAELAVRVCQVVSRPAAPELPAIFVRYPLKLSAVVTKAVVANCVVLVPAAAVSADGIPVNVGEAIFALAFICP